MRLQPLLNWAKIRGENPSERQRSRTAPAAFKIRVAAEVTVILRSSDALHADHIHPVTTKHLKSLKTVQQWTSAFSRLEEVVCVTAAENYRLEEFERAGITVLEKYAKAKITIVDSRGRTLEP